jgi:hypothetical protein
VNHRSGTILSEARKHGLTLTLAHQCLDQLLDSCARPCSAMQARSSPAARNAHSHKATVNGPAHVSGGAEFRA